MEVNDAILKHQEELEKEAQEKLKNIKTKKPQGKAKKGKKSEAVPDYERKPFDNFCHYFSLNKMEFEYCDMRPDCAPGLVTLFDKASQYLAELSFKGNQIGEQGLCAIGRGLELAGERLSSIQYPSSERTFVQLKETYAGTKNIKL